MEQEWGGKWTAEKHYFKSFWKEEKIALLWQSSRGHSTAGEQGLRIVWMAMPVQTALTDDARVQNAADEGYGLEQEGNGSS